MEAQQARIKHELVHNRRLREHDKKRTTMFTLTLRYARYVFAALTTIGFGLNTN